MLPWWRYPTFLLRAGLYALPPPMAMVVVEVFLFMVFIFSLQKKCGRLEQQNKAHPRYHKKIRKCYGKRT